MTSGVPDLSGNNPNAAAALNVMTSKRFDATGTSDVFRVRGKKPVQINFTRESGVGTVVLERALDGQNFQTMQRGDFTDASFTADADFELESDDPDVLYRFRCSAFTSGAINCLAGSNY